VNVEMFTADIAVYTLLHWFTGNNRGDKEVNFAQEAATEV
jgi:hypothetical protein